MPPHHHHARRTAALAGLRLADGQRFARTLGRDPPVAVEKAPESTEPPFAAVAVW